MAVDAGRISDFLAVLYFLYGAPLELFIALFFLFNLLGWSAFVGLLGLLVATPLQSIMTQIGVRLSKRIGNVRDARMTALSEYIKNYQARYVGTQSHRSHFISPQERTQPPLQAANRPERNEFPLDDRAGFRLGPRIRLVYPH